MRTRNLYGLFAIALVIALALAPGIDAAYAQGKKGQKGGKGGGKPGGGGATSGIPGEASIWNIPGDGVIGNGGPYPVNVDGGSDVDLGLANGRTLTFHFTDQQVGSSCVVGGKGPTGCKCDDLVGGSLTTSSGYLRVNIDTGSVKGAPALCDMGIGETMGADSDIFNVRAQANFGSCFVTWNALRQDAPEYATTPLDGLTVTRVDLTNWKISTRGAGRAWLWSEGKRNVRNNEGVFNMPFGEDVQITQSCG